MLRPLIGEQKSVKIAVIAKEDLEKLWEIDNDPEGSRYLRDPGQVFLQNDMEKLLEKLSSDKDTMRIYTIMYGETSEVVGSIGLYTINWKLGYAYIGYGISKTYWKRGITTSAVEILTKYCFETLNLRKLISSVLEPNAASRAVLEKNGFVEIGRYSKHSYVPGKGFVDEILYEKFNASHFH